MISTRMAGQRIYQPEERAYLDRATRKVGPSVDGVQPPLSVIDCCTGHELRFETGICRKSLGAPPTAFCRETAGAAGSAEIAQVRVISSPGGTRHSSLTTVGILSWPRGHYSSLERSSSEIQDPWVGSLELDRLKSILDPRVGRANGLSAGHQQRITGSRTRLPYRLTDSTHRPLLECSAIQW